MCLTIIIYTHRGSAFPRYAAKILTVIVERAFQRGHRSRGEGAIGVTHAHEFRHGARAPPRRRLPVARFQRPQVCATQGRPSRQGVHQPQDSCAKNVAGCRACPPDRCGRPGRSWCRCPRRLPTFSSLSKSIGTSRCFSSREIRRGAAGQHAAEGVTFAHAAGVLLQYFAAPACPSAVPTARAA